MTRELAKAQYRFEEMKDIMMFLVDYGDKLSETDREELFAAYRAYYGCVPDEDQLNERITFANFVCIAMQKIAEYGNE